jgi:hypothetical protein
MYRVTLSLLALALAFTVNARAVEDADDSTVTSTETKEAKMKKEKKDNFGSRVSAEAKRLRAEDSEDQGRFGEWVSSQRRQDGAHRKLPAPKAGTERRNERPSK